MQDYDPGTEVAKFIESHYETTPDRLLYVAQLGTWLSKSEIQVPKDKKVTTWIREVLAPLDRYEMIVDPEKPARIVIVPKDKADAARVSFQNPPVSSQSAHMRGLRALPWALVRAFTIDISPSDSIFFSDVPPFRFLIGKEPPSANYKEIDPSLRIQIDSSIAGISDADACRIYNNISKWCEIIGVSMERFMVNELPRPISKSSELRVVRDSSCALRRLIDAQAPEVRRRMLIPIDIVELLLNTP